MLRESAIVLTVQGKVKQKVIKKLTPEYSLHENQGWFFVDYAVEEIPLHSKFDVLLEGDNKKLVFGPGPFSIKLSACLDQFGNRLHSIPEGFKTICKLEFHPQIPSAIKKLSLLDEWDYNPKAISLASHGDIELSIPDFVLSDLYSIVYIQVKNTLAHKPKQSISKKEFVDFLKKSFKTHSSSANQILETLMQLGKVTQNDDNELELSEIEE